MSPENSFTALVQRHAITDTVCKAFRAFDENDKSVLQSACTDDVILTIDGAEAFAGLEAVVTDVLAMVGPLASTHMMSNVQIDITGQADSAVLKAYVLAQHCPPGQGRDPHGPKYVTGGDHRIELVPVDQHGSWKIKNWFLNVIWSQGDSSVVAQEVVAKS